MTGKAEGWRDDWRALREENLAKRNSAKCLDSLTLTCS
jgi:hypothetical protein